MTKIDEVLEKEFGIDAKNSIKQLTKPKRKELTKGHYRLSRPNIEHQVDVLYLPDDDGYKYCVMVVDVGSRKIAARPIQSLKSDGILKAIKDIYKNEMSVPLAVQFDSGPEFSKTKAFLKEARRFQINTL